MNNLYVNHICSLLSINKWQAEHCIQLLEEGATIPFISRYRKERTGSLDEVQVAEIKHYFTKFLDLDKRKESVLTSIEEQNKLTEELKNEIENCVELQRLEDIYLPFRPKRRTRASIAKEKGLEPLASKIFSFESKSPEKDALQFTGESVKDVQEALSGARDIISEWISEDISVRESLRGQYQKFARIISKPHKDSAASDESKYRNYFEFSGAISNIPAHRVLAILRGEREGELSVKLEVDPEYSLNYIRRSVYKKRGEPTASCREQIELAIEDSYKRLLHPSVENEALKAAKERADLESIKVFGENLTALLLAAPAGQKRVLALDPGFRTGCKVVCLSAQGELLHNDTIYPHPPVNEKINAIKKISNLVESYKIEIIAIGDGTASRETEAFIKKIPMPKGVQIFSVSEDGASVYSASPVAREEFPDYDVTVRGAVSIGRRVMDPLAELVKIDPKSIGVGQYQHDVDQSLLKKSLDQTVENAVNRVGVNLNTASKHLLTYVSGLGPQLAQNIVDYRTENGPFKSRKDILKVPKMGPKSFEQCAGFLRIPGAENPLDNSAVHPESYSVVEKMAKDLNQKVTDILSNKQLIQSIDKQMYITDKIGLPTITDILLELEKPGRDPRESVKVFEFEASVKTINDVRMDMELPGIVTNITNFGAFVDIGIKENGLIHVSNMSDKFVSNPSELISLHQHVKVQVLEVDMNRKRIQLKLLK